MLERPAVRERAIPISPKAYHLMFEHGLIGEKTELIAGVVVEKMPKSKLHLFLVSEIYRILTLHLPENLRVIQEQALRLFDSEPEPDIAIIEASAYRNLREHATSAHLVIEVASTTLKLDRDKADIYARANIPRYVIVNLTDRVVEEFTEPGAEGYTSVKTTPFGVLALWDTISFDLSGF